MVVASCCGISTLVMASVELTTASLKRELGREAKDRLLQACACGPQYVTVTVAPQEGQGRLLQVEPLVNQTLRSDYQ